MTTWVLFAGLPGTGKSTLARAMASRSNAAMPETSLPKAMVLDKDRVREVLFPGALTDYTREQDEISMRAILAAAAYLTGRRRVDFIFFDGRTFSRRCDIDQVLHAAERACASWRILHLICGEREVERRLLQPDSNHPAKNRDPALYRRIRQEFEPIPYPKLEVDTTRGIEPILRAVEHYLTSAGPHAAVLSGGGLADHTPG